MAKITSKKVSELAFNDSKEEYNCSKGKEGLRLLAMES